MQFQMKKVFVLLLVIGMSLLVGKVWYWQTDGFARSRIYGWTQELEGRWWNAEADRAICQNFTYLGRGRQAFAFVSQDRQYVLKFPRGDIYKLPFWLRVLPLKSWRKRQIARKALRELGVLQSAYLAMEELQDATALIAMNFSFRKGPEQKWVKLTDKAGRSHHIALSNTYFILQRRKELFRDIIQEAARKEGIGGVEKVLDGVFKVIVERTQKGILNRDGSFLRNYGFDEKRAYQTDVGSFFKVNQPIGKELFFRSMELSVKPIRRWMSLKHPEWVDLLDQKREQVLQHFAEL